MSSKVARGGGTDAVSDRTADESAQPAVPYSQTHGAADTTTTRSAAVAHRNLSPQESSANRAGEFHEARSSWLFDRPGTAQPDLPTHRNGGPVALAKTDAPDVEHRSSIDALSLAARARQVQAELSARRAELAALKGEYRRIVEATEAAREKARTYELAIKALKSSASWRLSAPLREVGRAWRKLLGGATTRQRQQPTPALAVPAATPSSTDSLDTVEIARRPSSSGHGAGAKAEKRQRSKPVRQADEIDYLTWVRFNDTLSDDDREQIRHHIAAFAWRPVISVVIVSDDSAESYLRHAIDSVRNQLYSNWELCVVEKSSSPRHGRSVLDTLSQTDQRIKTCRRQTREGASASRNAALALTSSDWTVFLSPDDMLAEHALYLVVDAINRHPEAALIYSDEDRIDAAGRRSDPYFKPDWDYDLFLGWNFIARLCAYRSDLVHRVGGFRDGFDGSPGFDLALRVLEAEPSPIVRHIPYVLYHRRQTSPQDALSNPTGAEAALRAANEHFDRTGQPARAQLTEGSDCLRISWRLPSDNPLVSIVIPTRDRADLLQTCTDGLLHRTSYERFEIVIVDNGSTEAEALSLLGRLGAQENVTVIEEPGDFNYSRLANRGVAESSGEVCVLLNNDVDVINPGWLGELVSHAMRPGVGAVGAKLYYADGTVQHGGVVLGIKGPARHVHKGAAGNAAGYHGRLSLTHNLSCVTAAVLATPRALFQSLGGFDERNLAVSYNDVDYCLRVRQAGYRIVWTPHAELFHFEKASRGRKRSQEESSRFRREQVYIGLVWGDVVGKDPYYNPNLTLDGSDFGLATAPRLIRPWRRRKASLPARVDPRSIPSARLAEAGL